jgi:hypothetical protein
LEPPLGVSKPWKFCGEVTEISDEELRRWPRRERGMLPCTEEFMEKLEQHDNQSEYSQRVVVHVGDMRNDLVHLIQLNRRVRQRSVCRAKKKTSYV